MIFVVKSNYVSVWDVSGNLIWDFVPESEIVDATSFIDINGMASLYILTSSKLVHVQSIKWTSPSLKSLDLNSSIDYRYLYISPSKTLYIAGYSNDSQSSGSKSLIIHSFQTLTSDMSEFRYHVEKEGSLVWARGYAVVHHFNDEQDVLIVDLKDLSSNVLKHQSLSMHAVEDFIVSNNQLFKVVEKKLLPIETTLQSFITSSVVDSTGKYYVALLEKANDQLSLSILDSNGKEIERMAFTTLSHASPKFFSFYYNHRLDSLRVLVQYNDLFVEVFHRQKLIWSKEEALSQVTHSLFINYPRMKQLSDHDEFSLFLTSIKSKKDQLVNFFNELSSSIALQEGDIASIFKKNTRHKIDLKEKERFGLRQILIVSTQIGKIFAFDTATGQIIWSKHMDGNVEYIIETNKLLSQVVVVVKKDSLYTLYTLNALTGDLINAKELTYPVKHIYTHSNDKDNSYIILVLSEDMNVFVEHASPEIKNIENIFLYLIQKETGTIQGLSIKSSHTLDEYTTVSRWNISLESPVEAFSAMKINTISPGRLLGNKTALYKYLNPNMIAVGTTRRDGESNSSTLSVYFIDTVSGRIVYSVNHKASSGDNGFSIVGVDNWAAYTYWSEKSHRYEMTALEFYVENPEWDKVNVSSFETKDLLVFKQSYTSSVKANVLSVSNTQQGITSKDLIMGMADGRLVSVSRKLVDPRRPETLTESDAAEGLIPYAAILPISPLSNLNYNITIAKIRDISVHPSRLESTSLIFAVGLDLFFTPYSSHMSYDRLSHGFSPIVIVVMVIGLSIIALLLKRLSDRSELKKMWK